MPWGCCSSTGDDQRGTCILHDSSHRIAENIYYLRIVQSITVEVIHSVSSISFRIWVRECVWIWLFGLRLFHLCAPNFWSYFDLFQFVFLVWHGILVWVWLWNCRFFGVTDRKINLRLQGQCWRVEAFGPCRRGSMSLPQINVSEGNSFQLVARHLHVRPWPRSIGHRIQWISVHFSNLVQAVWLAWHLVSLPDRLQLRKARGMAVA